MSHHFKCAVVKERSSTGEFLHGGFKPIVIKADYTRREYFYKLEAAIHELYPQVNGRTKLIVIGNLNFIE